MRDHDRRRGGEYSGSRGSEMRHGGFTRGAFICPRGFAPGRSIFGLVVGVVVRVVLVGVVVGIVAATRIVGFGLFGLSGALGSLATIVLARTFL